MLPLSLACHALSQALGAGRSHVDVSYAQHTLHTRICQGTTDSGVLAIITTPCGLDNPTRYAYIDYVTQRPTAAQTEMAARKRWSNTMAAWHAVWAQARTEAAARALNTHQRKVLTCLAVAVTLSGWMLAAHLWWQRPQVTMIYPDVIIQQLMGDGVWSSAWVLPGGPANGFTLAKEFPLEGTFRGIVMYKAQEP